MTFAYSYRAICWIYAIKCSSIGRVHKFPINKQLVGHVHCHVVHIHVHLKYEKQNTYTIFILKQNSSTFKKMTIYSTCSIFLSFSSCLTLYKNLNATANFLTSNKLYAAVCRFCQGFRSIWHSRGITWWYLCRTTLQKSISISC